MKPRTAKQLRRQKPHLEVRETNYQIKKKKPRKKYAVEFRWLKERRPHLPIRDTKWRVWNRYHTPEQAIQALEALQHKGDLYPVEFRLGFKLQLTGSKPSST